MASHMRTTTNTLRKQGHLRTENTQEIISSKTEWVLTSRERATKTHRQRKSTVHIFRSVDNYQNALNKLETDQLYNNKLSYKDSYR